LTPPAAAATYGSQVTINGSGFYSQGLTTQVLFNGVPATIILYGGVPGMPSYGNNQLTVAVPSNATTGPVTVKVGNVSSNSMPFTVEGPPSIGGIVPAQGQIGDTVFITGTGFGATQSNSTVSFYPGVAARIVDWSDTAIHVVVPGGTSTGVFNIQVATLTAQ